MTLYLIRHCETLGNKLNRTGGEIEVLLTLIGIEQAKSIGKRLFNEKEDFSKYLFISSPLIRAKHTLQIIMEILGQEEKNIVEEPLIKTKRKGIFDNMLKTEIIEKYPEEMIKKDENYWLWAPPGNGESYYQEYDRVKKFLQKYENEENMVICTHEGVCSVIKEVFNNKNEDEIKKTRKDMSYDQNYFYSYSKKNGLKRL